MGSFDTALGPTQDARKALKGRAKVGSRFRGNDGAAKVGSRFRGNDRGSRE
jgi:hypothetical protein